MAGGEFAGVDLAVMPETACLRGNRKVERKTIIKKLMFAAVAAAAGLMYGLESSNTVGYKQYALDLSRDINGTRYLSIIADAAPYEQVSGDTVDYVLGIRMTRFYGDMER